MLFRTDAPGVIESFLAFAVDVRRGEVVRSGLLSLDLGEDGWRVSHSK